MDTEVIQEEWITTEILHLPDRRFFQWCQNHYALNRGVYNTIDSRLYDSGIIHIIPRRTSLLSFLAFVSKENDLKHSAKFGPGGLSKKLEEFLAGS